jgi:uncharacterized SAM-binding protein YcdF (DUF218 family)
MDFFTTSKNVVTLLFLPPGLGVTLLAILGIGVLLLGKRSKWRTGVRCLFVICLALSYSLTTRAIGYKLAHFVEGDHLRALPVETLRDLKLKDAGPSAIVVLGGGLKYDGRESPNRLNLNQRTATRVHYAAYVAKSSGLPVLVTGGIGVGFTGSEASIMARTLREDYAVQVRWLEENSMTTAENALFSASLLKSEGIKKIVLVTQAYHMRRSALVFEAQGFEVVMAPCGFMGGDGVDTHFAWLPSLGGIEAIFVSSHEIIGLLYYRLKGVIPRMSYTP